MGSADVILKAFVDNGATLTSILNTQITGFKSTPKIAISPQLSLVVIYGASSSAEIINFYSIDYTDKTFEELDFPTETVFDPSNLYVILE
jgi:hypothetical protein